MLDREFPIYVDELPSEVLQIQRTILARIVFRIGTFFCIRIPLEVEDKHTVQVIQYTTHELKRQRTLNRKCN